MRSTSKQWYSAQIRYRFVHFSIISGVQLNSITTSKKTAFLTCVRNWDKITGKIAPHSVLVTTGKQLKHLVKDRHICDSE
ncbi:Hypothetical predicted protein [Octopus vulgaris]|uniref:Uncharacterized protein n=1 Tax=Octopus vulgaris TaxID=6645 RepID=A0AA36B8Y1_OCTVU|nr:Hypothetical predicted protein [Octopus vulgaris]